MQKRERLEIIYNIQLSMLIIWFFNLRYMYKALVLKVSSRTYDYDVRILLQAIQYTEKFGDTPKIFWRS